ncbi:ELMO domain-containing protein 3-like [Brevipalpus obovatus]|uniref:ELMO domain-containing protein 3-like n=1 Tax=Brevipalpus obovatus TaxID=246614 RepID=UPI003D9E757F
MNCLVLTMIGPPCSGTQKDEDPENKDLHEAQSQWDRINVIPIIDLTGGESFKSPLLAREISVIDDFELVNHYFCNLNLSSELLRIKPIKRKSLFAQLIEFIPLCGPVKLGRDLVGARDRVFAMALLPFNHQETIHHRFLATIYFKLTKQPIPSYNFCGNHWENVGFQGTDPATDLRGVGMLGLYQLLYFVLTPEYYHLLGDIHQISLDPIQNFPFAAMSTNITAIVLQILRSSKLNRHLNKRREVFTTINDLYCDLYLCLFLRWKKEKKTIRDAGYVLKEIRQMAKENLKSIIGKARKYESNGEERDMSDGLVQFTDIGNVFD